MIAGLTFLAVTTLLLLEGFCIARLVFKSDDRLLIAALALPFAALANVFLVFVWTILGISLTPITLLLPHVIITGTLGYVARKLPTALHEMNIEKPKNSWPTVVINAVCVVFIGSVVIYSFAHAVLLPTFQYDSATNWTMRSEISFVDQKIAFDQNEDRGMAKPQYPFLFHALQITENQGQREWNDTAANAILWLLSFGSFSAVYLLLRKLLTRLASLLTLTLVLGIPLLALHLGQGYADSTLAEELLLSLTLLLGWTRGKGKKWLLASAIIVASCVWTKSEGLFFALVPWLLAITLITFFDRNRQKEAVRSGIVAIALSIPWQMFALSKGMLLTPHSGDTTFGFHPEGMSEAFFGLFDRGSFGITWYVLVVAVTWMIVELAKSTNIKRRIESALLAWGMIVFLEVLFIYLCTPNVQFLLNAESYYRQMMIPAAMLLFTVCTWFGQANAE